LTFRILPHLPAEVVVEEKRGSTGREEKGKRIEVTVHPPLSSNNSEKRVGKYGKKGGEEGEGRIDLPSSPRDRRKRKKRLREGQEGEKGKKEGEGGDFASFYGAWRTQ